MLRYEVFKQDAPNQPHSHVGSVHAADAEMALMHARDVYGRRPNAVSMWVALETAIYARTAEALRIQNTESSVKTQEPRTKNQEISDKQPQSSLHNPQSTILTAQSFYVFRKTSQRRAMTYVVYVGVVAASDEPDALAQAITQFPANEVFVWWVCPESAISKTADDVAPSWFEPAKDKVYRQQAYYGSIGPKM